MKTNIQKERHSPPLEIILGIDPGTNILGYSVIHVTGKKMKLVEINILRTKRDSDHFQKLKEIFSGIEKVMEKFHPTVMAIEAPFFGKNIQSMLKLGRAQGVAITMALGKNIPVFEYSPRKIKQSITGNGNASKEQVAAILSQLLQFDSEYLLLDATDALGVAVCHHFQSGSQAPGGSPPSLKLRRTKWEQFVKLNPGRVGKK